MQLKNSFERYGSIAQLLHWTVVVLIIIQFVLANLAEDALTPLHQAKILTTHKNFGMTVFMLAIVRLGWRLMNSVPAPPPNSTPRQNRLASFVHWLLYALILATPLAGWLMSSAKSYTVSWFGLFSFPDLIAPDENRVELLKTVHFALAYSIASVATLHVAAALKHHFFDKDNVLRRMLPFKLK